MTSKETQNIEIAIQKKLTAIFSNPNNLNEIGKKLAERVKKIILERILAGYDMESRKFGNYNVGYNKVRAFKYAAKKFGTTQFASTSIQAKLRLTGHLLSSIDVKVLKIENLLRNIKFHLLVFLKDPTQIPKAIGLQSTTGVARNRATYSKKAYTFLGLAIAGGWKSREEAEIKKMLHKQLNEIITNNIKITRD